MVSYAKRAKRVDIKKLKDSVWKELEEVVLPVKHVSRTFSCRFGQYARDR